MSHTFALLVPVKALALAKSRLGVGQHRRARAADARLRPGRDRRGAAQCPRSARCTSSPTSRGFERRRRRVRLPDEGDGDLNRALHHAAVRVRLADPTVAVAAMCADLPCLRTDDLDAALAAGLTPRWFVADAAGTGTTLLARRAGHRARPALRRRIGPSPRGVRRRARCGPSSPTLRLRRGHRGRPRAPPWRSASAPHTAAPASRRLLTGRAAHENGGDPVGTPPFLVTGGSALLGVFLAVPSWPGPSWRRLLGRGLLGRGLLGGGLLGRSFAFFAGAFLARLLGRSLLGRVFLAAPSWPSAFLADVFLAAAFLAGAFLAAFFAGAFLAAAFFAVRRLLGRRLLRHVFLAAVFLRCRRRLRLLGRGRRRARQPAWRRQARPSRPRPGSSAGSFLAPETTSLSWAPALEVRDRLLLRLHPLHRWRGCAPSARRAPSSRRSRSR